MRKDNVVTIDAPVEKLWALTVDIEAWPSFTPTMTSVRRLDEGPLTVGSTAVVAQPGLGKRTWTVTTLEPQRRFVWETRLLGARLVGIHELEALDGGCRSRLVVEQSGLTSKLVGALAGGPIAKAIATENAGFKRRAEQAD